jgi:hypothetical protein
MYAKLKQDMRAANVPVSDGDELATSDMQPARDFLYFNGINIGEEFHRYEEVVHGTIAVASAPADTDAGDVGGDGDAGDDGDIVIGDTNDGGENAEEAPAPDQVQDPAPDQVQDPAPDQPAADQPAADQAPEQAPDQDQV